jgi:hypothetical protein
MFTIRKIDEISNKGDGGERIEITEDKKIPNEDFII